MTGEAAYVAEELANFWFTTNILILAWLVACLLLRARPSAWVALFKMGGLFMVLIFQAVASLVWFFHGLEHGDILVYAVWSVVAGWIVQKLGRQGLAMMPGYARALLGELAARLVEYGSDEATVVRSTVISCFGRNGHGDATLRATTVYKMKREGE